MRRVRRAGLMVLDSSAVPAILPAEPEAGAMVRAMATADELMIGAATLVDASPEALSKNHRSLERAIEGAAG